MQLRERGLTWHAVGSDVVVLDLEGSLYLKVNGSGRLLWDLLAEGCDVHALTQELIDRYGVDEQRAVADVAEFLDELRRRDLLVS